MHHLEGSAMKHGDRVPSGDNRSLKSLQSASSGKPEIQRLDKGDSIHPGSHRDVGNPPTHRPFNELMTRQFGVRDSPDGRSLTQKDYDIFREAVFPGTSDTARQLFFELKKHIYNGNGIQLLIDTHIGKPLVQLANEIYPGAKEILKSAVDMYGSHVQTMPLTFEDSRNIAYTAIKTVGLISRYGVRSPQDLHLSNSGVCIERNLIVIRANRALGKTFKLPERHNALERIYSREYAQAVYDALSREHITDYDTLRRRGDIQASKYVKDVMSGNMENVAIEGSRRVFVYHHAPDLIYRELAAKEQHDLRPVTPDDSGFLRLIKENSLLIWAYGLDRKLYFLPYGAKPVHMTHTMLVDGLSVLSAGKASFEVQSRPDGTAEYILVYVDNETGHYKASIESVKQSLPAFQSYGIQIAKDIKIGHF